MNYTQRPIERRPLTGCLLLLLFGLHLHTMLAHEPGLVDMAWSCNLAQVLMIFLLFGGIHPALNFAVFFWSALGSITWAIFLYFEPGQFRITSLSSHIVVPFVAWYFLRLSGVPRRAWLPALVLGEISFLLLVGLHPDRNFVFLFDYDSAPLPLRLLAVLVVQAYYGLLLWIGYRTGRRWWPPATDAA